MRKGLFARAAAGLNLTPGERAVLRLIEGIAAAALVAGATAAAPYLAGGTVNWQTVLHVFAAAAVASLLLALNKWSTAQGDPPLAAPSAPPDAPAVTISMDGRQLASTVPVAAQPPAPQA